MATGRVLGWDVLRGLSAVAVAGYHLLLWLDIAALHTLGSYGVYLFFVLSGASLAYTYAASFERKDFSMPRFLWVRYMRLAPLYLLLMLLVLPWKISNAGWSGALLTNLALNASFLFGFFDPAARAWLVGGWSLGIEAVFYLLFPLLMFAALRARVGWAFWLALLVLQAVWVQWTAGGPAGYAANAVRYHQVPAFAGYFMGGCLLGLARRNASRPTRPVSVVLAAIGAGFALMLLLNPAQQGRELVGLRGLVLSGLCFWMVWLAGALSLRGRAAGLAGGLGDATYGVYLIHPVVYFALALKVLPALGWGAPAQWDLPLRIGLALAIGAGVFVLALASDRYVERPLRQWSKARWPA